MGIDAFQTGSAKAPRDRSKRAFTVFNQTDDANRVQDILTALAYLQKRSPSQAVNLVGLQMGGVWSFFARALAGPGVSLAADGPSQMALPDVAFFRAWTTVRTPEGKPFLYVLQPADAYAAYALTVAMAAHEGPCYLRTLRPDVPFLYSLVWATIKLL